MDSQTLLSLIEAGESSRLELKVAPPRPGDLAHRLCGFANADGGYLIFGVEDKTLELVGVKNVGDAVDTILQAARLCKPTLLLEPPEPEVFVVKGKSLVVASIPPNRGTLYQASGVCWVRRGSHTVPMEVSEIEQFLYSRGLSSWERRPVIGATLEDLDRDIIQELITTRPERIRSTRRLDNLEELLINLDCAVRGAGGEPTRPTNAGMLLFGKYPQRFIIQAEVVCVLYSENLGSRRYTDRRIITGSVRELIDKAESFLHLYIPVPARVEGFHRIDEPDYPLEVLREAIVNAVVHRDYSLEGESIRIFYYPDRIEIRNPGQLLPGLTVEDLEQGRTYSKLRNPVLAGVLRDLPGGYMERMGSGVRFMLGEMERLGHPKPVFKQVGEFILTFYKNAAPVAPAHLPDLTSNTSNIVEEAVAIPASQPEPEPEPESLVSLEARLEKALRYLHEKGTITNQEYRTLTGVSKSTSGRDFEILVERGAIKPVGKRRSRYYTLP